MTQERSQWHQLMKHRLDFKFKESHKEIHFLAGFGSALRYATGHENQFKILAGVSLSRYGFNDSFYEQYSYSVKMITLKQKYWDTYSDLLKLLCTVLLL